MAVARRVAGFMLPLGLLLVVSAPSADAATVNKAAFESQFVKAYNASAPLPSQAVDSTRALTTQSDREPLTQRVLFNPDGSYKNDVVNPASPATSVFVSCVAPDDCFRQVGETGWKPMKTPPAPVRAELTPKVMLSRIPAGATYKVSGNKFVVTGATEDYRYRMVTEFDPAAHAISFTRTIEYPAKKRTRELVISQRGVVAQPVTLR